MYIAFSYLIFHLEFLFKYYLSTDPLSLEDRLFRGQYRKEATLRYTADLSQEIFQV